MEYKMKKVKYKEDKLGRLWLACPKCNRKNLAFHKYPNFLCNKCGYPIEDYELGEKY